MITCAIPSRSTFRSIENVGDTQAPAHRQGEFGAVPARHAVGKRIPDHFSGEHPGVAAETIKYTARLAGQTRDHANLPFGTVACLRPGLDEPNLADHRELDRVRRLKDASNPLRCHAGRGRDTAGDAVHLICVALADASMDSANPGSQPRSVRFHTERDPPSSSDLIRIKASVNACASLAMRRKLLK